MLWNGRPTDKLCAISLSVDRTSRFATKRYADVVSSKALRLWIMQIAQPVTYPTTIWLIVLGRCAK
jgi:hypothetical protein